MQYTINILKERIKKHQSKVKEIRANYPTQQSDIELAEDQIDNHLNSVTELQKGIIILINHCK